MASLIISCLIEGGIERERGRENGSFPVAETLKPLGFKEARSAE